MDSAHMMDHLEPSDVRRIIREELSLEHWEGSGGTAIIQLKLGDKPIGNALRIGLDWKQDHGHGGGSYVNGITLEEIGGS